MTKTSYSFAKRQKELEKQKKREEKRKKKEAKKVGLLEENNDAIAEAEGVGAMEVSTNE